MRVLHAHGRIYASCRPPACQSLIGMYYLLTTWSLPRRFAFALHTILKKPPKILRSDYVHIPGTVVGVHNLIPIGKDSNCFSSMCAASGMAALVVAGLVQAPTQNRRAAAGGCHRLDRRQAFTTPLRPPAEAPRLSTLILSLFAAACRFRPPVLKHRDRRQRAQQGRGRWASSPACSRPPSGVLGTLLASPCHLVRHNHC